MKSTKYLGIWMDHSIAHLIRLKIAVKPADKMSEIQRNSFVKEYFK